MDEMTDAAVLDLAVVDELRASVDGDEEFITELVRTYLAEGPENLAAMESAAAAGDAAAMVRPAHSLKSSSAALGAMRLSELAREIEYAGRSGSAEGLADRVEQAKAAWSATVEAMKEARLA
jgi:HPt (histidine-containing phosphotransfer) domain-containing protein